MSGVAHVLIVETQEDLEAMLRKEENPRVKERILALCLLKHREVSVIEVAKVLGRHRATVQRWLAAYRAGGLEAMLEFKTSPGRKPLTPSWGIKSLLK
jgi:predicted ArsR family transcriptional regulator